MTSGNVIDILGKMMAKYEIPLGMLNCLTALVQYWVRILVDDSGSMGNDTDTLRPDGSGRHYTRWEEVKIRLMEMVEILAHIPSLGIEIRALNRSDVIRIPREGGLTPEEFVRVVSVEVDRFFATPPDGRTPIMKALKKLDQKDHEIVYLFSDGVPDGGPDEVNDICDYLKKRKNPQLRPIVLLACTNEDASVAWMEDVEEEAGYCSAYDDFADEKNEILRDQGDRLPYTKGFYLVCALVGALFPNTLDALDDSGPIPRKIMSNMFGYEVTPEEYRLYFERFVHAQAARARAAGATADPTTTFKNTFDWAPAFEELMSTDKPLDGTTLGKKYHKRLHST